MKVYVFLIKRPKYDDKCGAWPCVYTDKELAEKAFGRVSPVVELEIGEQPNESE